MGINEKDLDDLNSSLFSFSNSFKIDDEYKQLLFDVLIEAMYDIDMPIIKTIEAVNDNDRNSIPLSPEKEQTRGSISSESGNSEIITYEIE